jgi:hypothetical protein
MQRLPRCARTQRSVSSNFSYLNFGEFLFHALR